ncbi:MAG: Trm112 family protein [Candidatus Brocadiales bacterium]|nr:Trm112 family protein [Candidatus Brocadiales bacterium]
MSGIHYSLLVAFVRNEFYSGSDTKMIDKELLEILACPLCKTDVKLENDKIVCTSCGRRYPIRDDIPIMLIDEAELPEGKDK